MKLSELAARLECTVEGDGEIDIRRVAAIEDAGPGDLTFFANPKYADALKRTLASAVIAAPAVSGIPCAVLRTPEPYVTFARALGWFASTWRRRQGPTGWRWWTRVRWWRTTPASVRSWS